MPKHMQMNKNLHQFDKTIHRVKCVSQTQNNANKNKSSKHTWKQVLLKVMHTAGTGRLLTFGDKLANNPCHWKCT